MGAAGIGEDGSELPIAESAWAGSAPFGVDAGTSLPGLAAISLAAVVLLVGIAGGLKALHGRTRGGYP